MSQEIRAVILDWSGTTVDYGSRAPTRAFVEVFRQHGVEITDEEARGPMGRSKRDHVAAVIGLPRVVGLWRERFSREPSDADVEALYDDFLPLLKRTVANHSEVIPGVTAAIAECRRRGWKIGSTTGYTRDVMEIVTRTAASAGYAADIVICSDDVPAGRPAPWMNYRAAEALGVYPMSSILIVDDTPVGIEAAKHAGGIAVAVTQSGNAIGLSESEVAALAPEDLQNRLERSERMFRAAGADFVIKSVAELPTLLP
ncbi:MAG TPA: phosphonoacetaldehyde hydrolase [Pirellulales bacterium]|nr:phosphonoacetaldehyde hydrolase [Pirellulales bacterium]